MEILEATNKQDLSSFEDFDFAFWQSLFSITTEQVMMIDTRGRVLFTNKGLFDVSAREAVGKSVFLLVPSAYAIILKNKIAEANKIKSKVKFESFIETKYGKKNLDLILDPVFDNRKEIIGYSLASIDTTAIKLAHRKFNYKANLEKLFLNISTKFINLPASKIAGGIIESLELISRFTNSEHAYIVLYDNISSEIGYEWHANYSSIIPFCTLSAVKKLLKNTAHQLESTDPVLIEPKDVNFGLNNDCPILVNPMMLEEKQYGALVLVGKLNAEEDWSEDFANSMMLFSNVFINTEERRKNSLKEEEGKAALEQAIKERTYAIEEQKIWLKPSLY